MSGEVPSYIRGTSVVGDTSFGDNGKGKMVDYLAEPVDLVVRFSGGSNAGHTVRNEYGESKLHLVPSGIFRAKNIVTSGVIIDPWIMTGEIIDLRNRGVKVDNENLLISRDSHLTMPWHKALDGIHEETLGKDNIGTTKRGIGPTYGDRTERRGLRVGDMFKPGFEEKFMQEFTLKSRLIRFFRGESLAGDLTPETFAELSNGAKMQLIRQEIERSPFDAAAMLEEIYQTRDILGPMVTNVLPVLWKAEEEDANILGEGAQGAMLDLDLGNYPYVTSSNPGLAGFSKTTGIYDIDHSYGVTKAYSTRVGNGPLPTEIMDEVGDEIREKGHEYGATTGRPRRVGWFDGPLNKYGAKIAGVRELALTKIDVLDRREKVKICVGYEVNGRLYDRMMDPSPDFLDKAKAVYETMPGWDESTSNARSFSELPKNAQNYVTRIGELTGLPVRFVSVGAEREETIVI